MCIALAASVLLHSAHLCPRPLQLTPDKAAAALCMLPTVDVVHHAFSAALCRPSIPWQPQKCAHTVHSAGCSQQNATAKLPLSLRDVWQPHLLLIHAAQTRMQTPFARQYRPGCRTVLLCRRRASHDVFRRPWQEPRHKHHDQAESVGVLPISTCW